MLALDFVPVPADALPAAVLVWDGGEVSPACDRSAELESNVAAYLGRDAFEAGSPLTIRVSLRRAADGRAIVADISQIGENGAVLGVRSVNGGSTCETLDDPLTLVVALMLDAPPTEPQTAASPTPEPPAPPEPPEARESEPTAIDTIPEDSEPAPGFTLLSAGVGTSVGLLPFPNWGPQLRVNLKPRRFWGISIGGLALLGSHTDLPGSGAIDFRLIQAGVGLCPLDGIQDRTWVSLCGGLEIAWLEAEGSELSPQRTKTDWTLSPALHVEAAQQLVAPVWLGGTLGVSFPTTRNRYTYRDSAGAGHLAFEVASPALTFGVFATVRVH